MHDFVNLPKDVKTYIVGFISHKDDLRSLYSTCRAWYEVAIAKVYHHITIPDTLHRYTVLQGLSSENRGLQYVRHVTVPAAAVRDPYDECDDEGSDWDSGNDYPERPSRNDNAAFVFASLAQLLPQDSLLTFTYDGGRYQDLPFFEALHRRQKNLRSMRLDDIGHIDHSRMLRLIESNGSTISTLSCRFESPFPADMCRHVIRHLPTLRNLEIFFVEYACRQARKRASLAITNSLLDSQLRGEGKQLSLSALQLRGLDLSDTAQLLSKAIDLSALEVLGFQQCSNPTPVFNIMKQRVTDATSTLRSLTVTGTTGFGGKDGDDSCCNDFLQSFSGLEYLIISASGKASTWPSFAHLATHASTLRVVYLDCPWPAETAVQESLLFDMKKTFGTCFKLEQLAIRGPTLDFDNLDDSPLDEPLQCLHDALAELPLLRCLSLICLPDKVDVVTQLQHDPYFGSHVQAQLRRYASQVFEAVPKLRILGIGADLRAVWYRNHINFSNVSKPCYVRGQEIDIGGGTRGVAIETKVDRLERIEPACDVLTLKVDGQELLRYGYNR